MKVSEMQAGREMDALVAEKVMEWVRAKCEGRTNDWWTQPGYAKSTPNFSTDIAAAWQVVEKIDLFSRAILERDEDGSWWVDDEPCHNIQSNASTAPLAICRAALLAMGVTEA